MDRWSEIACAAAGRNLTRHQWGQFGPADHEYSAICLQWPIGQYLGGPLPAGTRGFDPLPAEWVLKIRSWHQTRATAVSPDSLNAREPAVQEGPPPRFASPHKRVMSSESERIVG